MSFIETRDLSIPKGKAWKTVNGTNRVMGEISRLQAQINYTKATRKNMSSGMIQNKVVSKAGQGNLRMYMAVSDYVEMAAEEKRTGNYPAIDIKAYNEDETSTLGRQMVILRHVIFDSLPLVDIDDQSTEFITFETAFSFDDWEPVSAYTRPAYLED